MKIKWIICLIIAIFCLSTGFGLGRFSIIPLVNSTNELKDIGSIIGAIIGTIVAIVAIIISMQTNHRQNKQFERQSFENVFFQMMTLYAQRKNNLESEQFKIKGVSIYDNILKDIRARTDGYLKPEAENSYKTLLQDIINRLYKNELGILILQFKFTLKYIDKSDNKQDTKRDFVNIYYSQLSLSEVELLLRITKIDSELEKLFERYPYLPNRN